MVNRAKDIELMTKNMVDNVHSAWLQAGLIMDKLNTSKTESQLNLMYQYLHNAYSEMHKFYSNILNELSLVIGRKKTEVELKPFYPIFNELSKFMELVKESYSIISSIRGSDKNLISVIEVQKRNLKIEYNKIDEMIEAAKIEAIMDRIKDLIDPLAKLKNTIDDLSLSIPAYFGSSFNEMEIRMLRALVQVYIKNIKRVYNITESEKLKTEIKLWKNSYKNLGKISSANYEGIKRDVLTLLHEDRESLRKIAI